MNDRALARELLDAPVQEGLVDWGNRLKELVHRRNPDTDKLSDSDRIRKSERVLNRATTHSLEPLPPKFSVGRDQDIALAARQPFTAMEYALENGHDPRLWAAVQGSPYEAGYRRIYGDQIRESV